WQKKYDREPKLWFHDILRGDGRPYRDKEVSLIKELTGKHVDVLLRFSVETLDPLKPDKSFVECVVRNKSKQAVRVPRYSGGWGTDMMLRVVGPGGWRFHDLHLVIWAGDTKKGTVLVNAGEEAMVFKDDLNAVLRLDLNKGKPLKPKEPHYYWSWSA